MYVISVMVYDCWFKLTIKIVPISGNFVELVHV